MVQRCVVKFCSNSDKTAHSVHKVPRDPSIRRQWVAFVKVKRADFSESSVTKHTVLCGAHFTRESFSNLLKYELNFCKRRELYDTAVPTIQPVPTGEELRKERALLSKKRHTGPVSASRGLMVGETDRVSVSHQPQPSEPKEKKSRSRKAFHKREILRVSIIVD